LIFRGALMAHTNDTIADMLTRIRNATMARHESVAVPATA